MMARRKRAFQNLHSAGVPENSPGYPGLRNATSSSPLPGVHGAETPEKEIRGGEPEVGAQRKNVVIADFVIAAMSMDYSADTPDRCMSAPPDEHCSYCNRETCSQIRLVSRGRRKNRYDWDFVLFYFAHGLILAVGTTTSPPASVGAVGFSQRAKAHASLEKHSAWRP